jgi:hypothetical protein
LRAAGGRLVGGGHAIDTAPWQPDVLPNFDHLRLETPNRFSHFRAPTVDARPGALGSIQEILDRGADDLGSNVKRPSRDDCLASDPSAIGGRARRTATAFGKRARERRGAAHTAKSLRMPKRRDRAPIVVLDDYRLRLSADIGDRQPISG